MVTEKKHYSQPGVEILEVQAETIVCVSQETFYSLDPIEPIDEN